MMRKICFIASAVCFITALTGPIFAQEASKKVPPLQPSPHGAMQGKQIVGEVLKVDVKAKRITVKSEGKEKQFDVSPSATLGGYGTLADVKQGQKVAILYEEKDGKFAAKVVMNHTGMMKGPQAPAK